WPANLHYYSAFFDNVIYTKFGFFYVAFPGIGSVYQNVQFSVPYYNQILTQKVEDTLYMLLGSNMVSTDILG
ncbi:hypothetical protein L9F63_017676, partial [Diploptera punctata]